MVIVLVSRYKEREFILINFKDFLWRCEDINLVKDFYIKWIG